MAGPHDCRVAQYTVGDVARLAGISVRTLHHYDDIGLVRPHGRSAGNYRLYSQEDLRRLRQVLFYRELEFGLDAIADILADPDAHGDEQLRRQHRLLRERQARTEALLGAVEREIRARRMGISLTPEEQLEIFGTDRFAERAAEAGRDRVGTVEETRPPVPTAAYTKDDWLAIKAEADANIRMFADALLAGEPATGPVAMRAAEEHRAHISRWFYPCSHEQHREVAAAYVATAEHSAAWEDVAPGFSRYVHDAIVANSRRAGHGDTAGPR